MLRTILSPPLVKHLKHGRILELSRHVPTRTRRQALSTQGNEEKDEHRECPCLEYC